MGLKKYHKKAIKDENAEVVGYQTIEQQSVRTRGAPGAAIVLQGLTYIILNDRVQWNNLRKGDNRWPSPAWRNNNPVNLTVDNEHPEAWSYGAYRGRNTEGRFAIFPDIKTGLEAARKWMRKQQHKTILSYFQEFAPKGDAANHPERYAGRVAEGIGSFEATTGNLMCDIEIRELKPELIENYRAFFDHAAFADNPGGGPTATAPSSTATTWMSRLGHLSFAAAIDRSWLN